MADAAAAAEAVVAMAKEEAGRSPDAAVAEAVALKQPDNYTVTELYVDHLSG